MILEQHYLGCLAHASYLVADERSGVAAVVDPQRVHNYALQPMGRAEFLRIVTADQPDAPPYFGYDAALNAREHPPLSESLERELSPLSFDELLALQRAGARVLDTGERTSSRRRI